MWNWQKNDKQKRKKKHFSEYNRMPSSILNMQTLRLPYYVEEHAACRTKWNPFYWKWVFIFFVYFHINSVTENFPKLHKTARNSFAVICEFAVNRSKVSQHQPCQAAPRIGASGSPEALEHTNTHAGARARTSAELARSLPTAWMALRLWTNRRCLYINSMRLSHTFTQRSAA